MHTQRPTYPQFTFTMESNEAAFVAEAEVEQELRARSGKSTSQSVQEMHYRPNKSPSRTSESEDAPLLSDHGSRRGSSDSTNSKSSQWNGMAEFASLPWWKRPSVSITS